MAEDREMLHARERIVQQMGRNGLTEENMAQGTLQNISSRQADFSLSGEGQTIQAHDRSRNRIYYPAADNGPAGNEPNQPETVPESGNTAERGTEASPVHNAAASPSAPAMEPEAWEELTDVSAALPKEFAGFADRIAQISSENQEKGVCDDAARKAGEFTDYKNRQMKAEIRREKKRQNRQLQYKEEPEEEDNDDGDGTESRGEKKPETEKEDKNKRLQEEGKELLKFRKEKEAGEGADRLKKHRKRLRFDEAKEEATDGGSEKDSLPDAEKKKKDTEKEDTEKKRKRREEDGEEGDGGEGKEEEEKGRKAGQGRLKFEEDEVRGSSLKGRLIRAYGRKAFRRFEEEQEEELDFGAQNAYRAGKGVLRGTIYFSRKSRLIRLKAEAEARETENTRLQERGKSRQEMPAQDKEGERRRLQDKGAAASRLKNQSRYLKNQEKINRKKAYQRKINRQKSMEIAQNAQKGSEFVAAAKAAAVKAAAALKSGALVLLAILLFLLTILFTAGYLLSSLLHMGEAGLGAMYGGLYQSTYSDITDCEGYYRELETDLEEMIAGIEEDEAYGDCHEFIYALGNIGHRAVDLISYLAAKYTEFTLETCRDELDALFEAMYTLEIETEEETCHVILTVKPWEEIMEDRLTEEETGRYQAYLMSQGGQQVYGNPLPENWQDKISSPFGCRIHPLTKEKTPHNGIDIAVPEGTPLFSCTDGTVVTARYSESAGNYIEVLTESGYTVRYLHLDSTGVSAGEKVDKGMLIGATGNTGRSTGPHLHLEIRTPEGNPIDPTFIVANGEGRAAEEQE